MDPKQLGRRFFRIAVGVGVFMGAMLAMHLTALYYFVFWGADEESVQFSVRVGIASFAVAGVAAGLARAFDEGTDRESARYASVTGALGSCLMFISMLARYANMRFYSLRSAGSPSSPADITSEVFAWLLRLLDLVSLLAAVLLVSVAFVVFTATLALHLLSGELFSGILGLTLHPRDTAGSPEQQRYPAKDRDTEQHED